MLFLMGFAFVFDKTLLRAGTPKQITNGEEK